MEPTLAEQIIAYKASHPKEFEEEKPKNTKSKPKKITIKPKTTNNPKNLR